MTTAQAPAVAAYDNPPGVAARGTLVVVPGRGEHAGLHERFGRRLAFDAYRVRVVGDPTADPDVVTDRVREALGGPGPNILVGSDTGALFAAGLVADGVVAVDALILVGVPGATEVPLEDELSARTTCPTHRTRLDADPELRRGALSEPPPSAWVERADPARLTVPVLGLHGADDPVTPLADARAWFDRVPGARLVSLRDTTHDALNGQTHRTAATEVVRFLERLRLGADLPAIARVELAGWDA